MTAVSFLSVEDFTAYKNEKTEQVQAIVIPIDINPAISINILHDLDYIYGILRIDFAEIEGTKDRYEKLIGFLEKTQNTGSNTDERKRNAANFISSYESNGSVVNLYNIYSTIYERYVILKGLIDIISNKQSKMITILGVMKLDKELGNGY